MADAYGTLVLSCSKDAEINRAKLCDALNEYKWDADGGQWVINDGKIWFSIERTPYPHAIPEIEVHKWTSENDEEMVVSDNDITDEQLEEAEDADDYESDSEDVPLGVIAAALVPFIHKGSITIASCFHEKQRNILYQSLTVSAQGEVATMSHFYFADAFDTAPRIYNDTYQMPEKDLLLAKLKG